MLNNFHLKLIAVITMTIDHIGYFLMQNSEHYDLFRIIGRTSYIVFCFLLVEGFNKTSNKTRYISIIGGMAFLLSVIPQYILQIQTDQNIFNSLFLGLLILSLFKSKQIICIILGLIMFVFLSQYVDYGMYGLSVIIMFYFVSKIKRSHLNKLAILTFGILINIFFCILIKEINFYDLSRFSQSFMQIFSIFGFIVVLFYNNKRGYYNVFVKYLIYVYYPVHISILYYISTLI